MPQVSTENHTHKRRVLIAILAAVLVLVAAGVAIYLVHKHNIQAADNSRFNSLLTISNLSTQRGQYDQAANMWLVYEATSPSKDHQQTALINAATLYLSNSEYSKTISVCQKSEHSFGATFKEAEVAAYASTRVGDKSSAIHYYQEAIRLVPPNLSDKDAEVDIFNRAIKQLQAAK